MQISECSDLGGVISIRTKLSGREGQPAHPPHINHEVRLAPAGE